MTQQTQMVANGGNKPMQVMKGILDAESVRSQFGNALGKHRDTFIASIIDLYSGDKALQSCEPAEVVKQALKAAVLKLPINKALGFSYIVVYNNNVKNPDGTWTKVPTPVMITGYKGLIQLAMRTGQYKTINADVVFEGEIGKVDKLSGAISFDGQKKSDKVIGYFAHFELLNGFKKTLYMSVEDMAEYAKRYSPSIPRNVSVQDLIAKATSGEVGKQVGWMGNFNDMAMKTCMRRLLGKYGYLSVEMQGAMAEEIESEAAATRNDTIAAEANTEEVVLDDVQFADVDAQPTATEEPEPMPEY